MNDELHITGLIGAYVLDALDAEETARVDLHVATCAECREEVDSLRETAARLVTPVPAPDSLRASVLAGISQTRQLPPLPATAVGMNAETNTGTNAVTNVVPLAARRSRIVMAVGAVAAAVVVVAMAVTGLAVNQMLSDTPDTPVSMADRVMADPNAIHATVSFNGATAEVVKSIAEGHTVITATDLPTPAEGRAYQLWFIAPGHDPVSAGMLPDSSDVTMVLSGDDDIVVASTAVAMTIEPSGGSAQPTREPIAVFPLTTG